MDGIFGRRNNPGAVSLARSVLTAAFALAVLFPPCGCTPPTATPPPVAVVTKPMSALLRYKRVEGLNNRYEANIRIKVHNERYLEEKVRTLLQQTCDGKSPQGFDIVYFRRRDLERSHVEVDRKRTPVRDSEPLNIQPPLSPNFFKKPGSASIYYLIDDRGKFCMKQGTDNLTGEKRLLYPFHYAMYDSLSYFFPTLPEKEVSAGDTWEDRTPVIVGNKYANNEFELVVKHKLEKFVQVLRGRSPVLCAEISYSVEGLFDTGSRKYKSRFSAEYHERQRHRHEITGSGCAFFDVAAGCILWKRETFGAIVQFGRVELAGGRKKKLEPGWKSTTETTRLEFSARLLAPGELPRPPREPMAPPGM